MSIRGIYSTITDIRNKLIIIDSLITEFSP